MPPPGYNSRNVEADMPRSRRTFLHSAAGFAAAAQSALAQKNPGGVSTRRLGRTFQPDQRRVSNGFSKIASDGHSGPRSVFQLS